MKLGLICRSDKTGLGNQTRNLAYMLKLHKLMLIDSTPFNGNRQYPETYGGFVGLKVRGFPTNYQFNEFLKGIDAVLSCETFYNATFVGLAKRAGVKTFLMYNYEFLDNLQYPSLPVPDVLLSPSTWKLEEMSRKYRNVELLPPPTDHQLFNEARSTNFKRSGQRRFLHILGKEAIHDRNGTQLLLKALEHTSASFELVIKAQDPPSFKIEDPRVRIDISNPLNEGDLYKDFDALIMPRRYGGLCLPMNEGLMSGLPVVMPDIMPNNSVLPPKWLVRTDDGGQFMTRVPIDLHDARPTELAAKIDEFVDMNEEQLLNEKSEAFEIGYNIFSMDKLKPRYKEIFG